MIKQIHVLVLVVMAWGMAASAACGAGSADKLRIGWAHTDITPSEPVYLAGQFHARVSEGVMDPVTATALAFESTAGSSPTSMVLVSCDLICIYDSLRDAVREHLRRDVPDLDPKAVILNGTHTHSAPLTATHERYMPDPTPIKKTYGVDLEAMSPADYVTFAAKRIADAVAEAWKARAPGGIGYGLGHAVVGRNRLTAYRDGRSRMYGPIKQPDFSHMEGSEDPSLHVLATYDADGRVTGLILNLACPSQVSESSMEISADFWHETRLEVRRRVGAGVHVLAQTGPAGDQSPHLHGNECRLPGRAAGKENPEARMWRLAGRTQREQLAVRIADAVASVLPLIEKEIDWDPMLAHRIETVELPRRIIPEQDAKEAETEAAKYRATYEALMRDLEAKPELRRDRGWISKASRAHQLMRRHELVVGRFQLQKTHPALPIEVHVARLGDVAFATSPFEFYLDYGKQIQSRTLCVQAFLIQLVGPGTYLPTERSVAGGAYGAVPASTEVGPDGGRYLVDWTVKAVNAFWEK